MSALTLRIITAVILAVGFLAVLFFAPVIYAAAFLSFALLIAITEWAGFAGWKPWPGRTIYALVAAAVMLASWQQPEPQSLLLPALAVAAIMWVLALLALLSWTRRIAKPVVVISGLLFLLPAWLTAERLILAGSDGPVLLFLLFWIVAAADIGAYFTGKALGKHKLLPRVSPGKTIEGLIGGLISAAVAACLGHYLLDWALPQAALLGVSVGMASVVGDLTVSLFKRNAGLKDSGKILPGHGGVLDRIDGVVAALPLYTVLLSWFGKLPPLIMV